MRRLYVFVSLFVAWAPLFAKVNFSVSTEGFGALTLLPVSTFIVSKPFSVDDPSKRFVDVKKMLLLK